MGLTNTKIIRSVLSATSPTLNFEAGHIANLPVLKSRDYEINNLISQLREFATTDWDAYETSWDFTGNPLIQENADLTLSERYSALRARWQAMTNEMQRLEEENNRIFIEAYGLQDELTPDVPLEEITLTCNPHYRYRGNLTDEQREVRLREDTVKELLSYAVGCLFGRYALQKPGLILANQGDTLEDYWRIVDEELEVRGNIAFTPSESGVIPLMEGGWFADDITSQCRRFLRAAFGEEHFTANLRFIEEALGKSLTHYFLRDFYKDHVQTYKKRPIYWLFASPKGAFNALIYLHRYESSTPSVVLKYLREYRDKLTAHRENLAKIADAAGTAPRDKTRALKEIEDLSKTITELQAYEDKTLLPLALNKLSIDLDDGVAVNYEKFGDALKKI